MIAFLVFNKVRNKLKKDGFDINEYIYVNFSTKKIVIDGKETPLSYTDLSEVSEMINGVTEILLTKKEVTIRMNNGETKRL